MNRIRRVAVAVAAVAFTMLFMASTVEASPLWCEEDPILFVNGAMVHVVTSFPRADLGAGTVVRYTVTVGNDAQVRVVLPPSRIKATVAVVHAGGSGQRVTIHTAVTGGSSTFPVVVSVSGGGVRVPAKVTGTAAGVSVTVQLGR